MITPALLISACGTLVLSTSNRLSRVIERVRGLSRDAEQLSASVASESEPAEQRQAREHQHQRLQDKRLLITRQVTSAAQRAVILRAALGAFYAAIGLLVSTSIAVGVLTWLRWQMTWPIIALALAGAGALLWGSVLLVREGRIAIGSTLDEMQYIRGLVGDVASGESARRAGGSRQAGA